MIGLAWLRVNDQSKEKKNKHENTIHIIKACDGISSETHSLHNKMVR